MALYDALEDHLFGAAGSWTMKRCPKPSCGLLWLDPTPVEEDLPKAYKTYYTHTGAPRLAEGRARRLYARIRNSYLRVRWGYPSPQRGPWDGLFGLAAYLLPLRRATIDMSIFWLPSRTSGCLLEIGCGSGAMLRSLQDLGWRVEGLDFDPAAVEQAKRQALDVRVGALPDPSLAAGSFDAVVANHVLEHVPDARAVLRECKRLLKPGGLLVLTTPNAESWGHRLYSRSWRGLEPPRHLRIFTASSLARLSAEEGLHVRRCGSFARASTILLESRALRREGHASPTFPPSLPVRICATAITLIQWAATSLGAQAGEELVLICTR